MKKKGFTLVEIIVVISLIAFIGTISFFGIRLVNKNIRISKLKQITNRAIQAAQIYVETNNVAKNQLYKNKNGVVIPLNVLVNEGLLSLDNTDLKKSDIEGEYIVTALSSTTKNGDCTEINEVTSWNSDAPIYLCLNEYTGASSLQTVGASANNISRVTREKYYFTNYNENRIRYKHNGTEYNYYLYYIEKDDSLALISEDSFGNVFDNVTEPQFGTVRGQLGITELSNNTTKVTETGASYSIYQGEALISMGDLSNIRALETKLTQPNSVHYFPNNPILYMTISITPKYSYPYECANYGVSFNINGALCSIEYKENKGYKIHLSPCMKITGGAGTEAYPYELTNLCS